LTGVLFFKKAYEFQIIEKPISFGILLAQVTFWEDIRAERPSIQLKGPTYPIAQKGSVTYPIRIFFK
jgi:hypothetical protein